MIIPELRSILQDNRTAFMRASFAGHVDVVNELILAKADVNRRDTVCGTWVPTFSVYCISDMPKLDAGHWHDCSVCTELVAY